MLDSLNRQVRHERQARVLTKELFSGKLGDLCVLEVQTSAVQDFVVTAGTRL
jgi:hypothetical protein